MIWATLIFLGIPIWLILGALGGGLWSRHRFQQQPGVFPIRVRVVADEEEKWSGKMHALWVHDVLLANKGFARVRTMPYGVQRIARPVAAVDASTIKGLGDDPVSFVVIVDDGRELEIVTDLEHAGMAIGSFDASHTGDNE